MSVAPVTQKASSPSFFFWPTLPIAMMMRLMFGTRQTAYEQVIGRRLLLMARPINQKTPPLLAGYVHMNEKEPLGHLGISIPLASGVSNLVALTLCCIGYGCPE